MQRKQAEGRRLLRPAQAQPGPQSPKEGGFVRKALYMPLVPGNYGAAKSFTSIFIETHFVDWALGTQFRIKQEGRLPIGS